MARMKRVSFTVPADVADEIAYIAKRVGVSRSALVTDVLRETIDTVGPMIRSVPESPTDVDVVRFRGESERVVTERLEHARRLKDDLFSGLSHGGGNDD